MQTSSTINTRNKQDTNACNISWSIKRTPRRLRLPICVLLAAVIRVWSVRNTDFFDVAAAPTYRTTNNSDSTPAVPTKLTIAPADDYGQIMYKKIAMIKDKPPTTQEHKKKEDSSSVLKPVVVSTKVVMNSNKEFTDTYLESNPDMTKQRRVFVPPPAQDETLFQEFPSDVELSKSTPKLVHLVFGLEEKPHWGFVRYSNTLSLLRNIEPDALVIWYKYVPRNDPWWDRTVSLPNVVLVDSARQADTLFGKKIQNTAHRADAIRVEILWVYGGIYVDSDFVAVARFDDLLRSGKFIAGAQFPDFSQSANAVMISPPRHPTLEKYIRAAATEYDPKCWGCYSVLYLAELVKAADPSTSMLLGVEAFFSHYYTDMKGGRPPMYYFTTKLEKCPSRKNILPHISGTFNKTHDGEFRGKQFGVHQWANLAYQYLDNYNPSGMLFNPSLFAAVGRLAHGIPECGAWLPSERGILKAFPGYDKYLTLLQQTPLLRKVEPDVCRNVQEMNVSSKFHIQEPRTRICLDDITSGGDCVVYAFDVIANHQWEFDDFVSGTVGCQTLSFDPNLNTTLEHSRNPKHRFYPGVRLGTANTQGNISSLGVYNTPTLRTIESLMQEHTHSSIDLLRLDVKGSGWDVFRQWVDIQDSILNSGAIKSIVLEIHLLSCEDSCSVPPNPVSLACCQHNHWNYIPHVIARLHLLNDVIRRGKFKIFSMERNWRRQQPILTIPEFVLQDALGADELASSLWETFVGRDITASWEIGMKRVE